MRRVLALLAALLALPAQAQEASLAAPAEVAPGARVEVAWTGPGTGPGTGDDAIAIARPGSPDFLASVPTAWGSPAVLAAPAEPGLYDLLYVRMEVTYVEGLPATATPVVLAVAPLLVAGGAALMAPEAAPAGQPLSVEWTGPNADGDYVAVARPGAPPEGWEGFAPTLYGSPATVLMPAEPGPWELRYQNGRDGTVLAARPIRLE